MQIFKRSNYVLTRQIISAKRCGWCQAGFHNQESKGRRSYIWRKCLSSSYQIVSWLLIYNCPFSLNVLICHKAESYTILDEKWVCEPQTNEWEEWLFLWTSAANIYWQALCYIILSPEQPHEAHVINSSSFTHEEMTCHEVTLPDNSYVPSSALNRSVPQTRPLFQAGLTHHITPMHLPGSRLASTQSTSWKGRIHAEPQPHRGPVSPRPTLATSPDGDSA